VQPDHGSVWSYQLSRLHRVCLCSLHSREVVRSLTEEIRRCAKHPPDFVAGKRIPLPGTFLSQQVVPTNSM
jgi:hypothetical protein